MFVRNHRADEARDAARVAGDAALIAALAIGLATVPAHAGLTDKLKSKITKKAEQKTEEVVDGATGEAAPAGEAAAEGTDAEAGKSGDESGKVSDVSTKFDFVPGDKVLFYDDFTQDELGEFPAQWKLAGGNFEVVDKSGERWLRCTSADGHVRMKLPGVTALPEFWTFEMDLTGLEKDGPIALTVAGISQTGSELWNLMFPYNVNDVRFSCGDISSQTPLEGSPVTARHHIMLMARGTALKAYVDRERVANVPDVTGPGKAVEIDIRLWAPSKEMITNVRFAEGCKPPKDMLASGKLVTYGIHFASGSDVVLPDSAPVMRQVAAYLESNGSVKLKITGHTDNAGTSDGNLDLSKRRAASVAKVLTEQFKIAADRFVTDGKGDTEKVADNGTSAGRAMNRRVEFAKT
jgi:outer membrane protein OmpA-like peptidoglycan-associated protein